jgi:hypothetical protein
LGLRDWVIYNEGSYRIPSERFKEAERALVNQYGRKWEQTQIAQFEAEQANLISTVQQLIPEKAKLEREVRLEELLGEAVISGQLWEAFLELMEETAPSIIAVAEPDIAVCLTSRSQYGGSGGIGYFDQVRAYYHGSWQMAEWQWRDQYSQSRDRHDLCVNGFGKLEVTTVEGTVNLRVELENRKYRNRWHTFKFSEIVPEAASASPVLTEEEQKVFADAVDAEMGRVQAELDRLWKCKPQMMANPALGPTVGSGYVAYQQPRIKQERIKIRFGVAAFVTEE